MQITKVSFGTVFNHSTVKHESISVFLTFENNGYMDVVTLNIHYVDTDGTKVLSWFTPDEFDARYYLDTVSVDVCDYLNEKIIHNESCLNDKFEVTDAICNYIDNTIDELMNKYKIKEYAPEVEKSHSIVV